MHYLGFDIVGALTLAAQTEFCISVSARHVQGMMCSGLITWKRTRVRPQWGAEIALAPRIPELGHKFR